MMCLYEGHMGNLFLSEESIPWDELYCETCGDSDIEIGRFESAHEVLAYMADDISVDGSGGWAIEHVLEVLSEFSDCPSEEEAIKIIKENQRNYEDEND